MNSVDKNELTNLLDKLGVEREARFKLDLTKTQLTGWETSIVDGLPSVSIELRTQNGIKIILER